MSGKLITIDGASSVRTKEQKRRETLIKLNESLKAKKPIKGVVKGVEKLNSTTSVAVVYVDDFKVIIPTNQMIEVTPVAGRDPSQWGDYLLSKRLGSEIDFIICGIQEKDNLAVANRLEAMKRISEERIIGPDPANPLLHADDLVEARIVCSKRAGVYVEILGVETYIPSKELSYQRIQDATIDFPVGEFVVVKIVSIKVDPETKKIEIEASVKQAEENPYEKAMKLYNENDKYCGKVSMIDQHGIFVALEGGVDVLCPFPKRGTRPTRGTDVTVRITTKNVEQNRIFGLITHVSPAR